MNKWRAFGGNKVVLVLLALLYGTGVREEHRVSWPIP